MPRALIVGVAGQDGSYLAELLLSEGYEVHGAVRAGRSGSPERLSAVRDRVRLREIDLRDQSSVDRAVSESAPDEVYNLAGESFMPTTWERPVETSDVSALGAARLLESLRRLKPDARFCQASSSEMFGRPASSPQNETTPLAPLAPYGCAKVFAHHLVSAYRQKHGTFAVSAVLFSHESPRRRPEFVTRKIARGAARIKLGLDRELRLGRLDAKRDWTFAGDTVEAMRLSLRRDKPDDYVVASGVTRTVEDFVRAAFSAAGLDWRKHVVYDESLARAEGGAPLCGDASKARRELGWSPRVGFEELVGGMVAWDLECQRTGAPELSAPWKRGPQPR